MKLTLASAAAPGAGLDELLAACERRGFAALELEEGHSHGLAATDPPERARVVAAAVREAGIRLAAFRLGERPADPRALARLTGSLDAPGIVEIPASLDDPDAAAALAFARAAHGEGARVLLGTADPLGLLHALGDGDLLDGIAWEARPSAETPVPDPERLLERAGDRLRHVRLHGGGPETHLQAGMGVGTLVGRLALAGWGGTFALAPTSPRYRVAWDVWLGRRGGSGCGSKRQDPGLVTLTSVAPS